MTNTTTSGELPEQPAPVELWDRQIVCAFFGGTKPLSLATLYRGMRSDIYPRPVITSGNAARWLGHECRAALDRMIAKRDEPRGKPERRGRPRRVTADATA